MDNKEKKDNKPPAKHCRDCYDYKSNNGGFSGWCPIIHCAVFGACTCTAPKYLNIKEGDQLSMF